MHFETNVNGKRCSSGESWTIKSTSKSLRRESGSRKFEHAYHRVLDLRGLNSFWTFNYSVCCLFHGFDYKKTHRLLRIKLAQQHFVFLWLHRFWFLDAILHGQSPVLNIQTWNSFKLTDFELVNCTISLQLFVLFFKYYRHLIIFSKLSPQNPCDLFFCKHFVSNHFR